MKIDAFLPINVVSLTDKFSDLSLPSNFLFLIFTLSETVLLTTTFESLVDPKLLILDKHSSARFFR